MRCREQRDLLKGSVQHPLEHQEEFPHGKGGQGGVQGRIGHGMGWGFPKLLPKLQLQRDPGTPGWDFSQGSLTEGPSCQVLILPLKFLFFKGVSLPLKANISLPEEELSLHLLGQDDFQADLH